MGEKGRYGMFDDPEYRVRLTRVENGSALRTSEVEGTTSALPAVGKPFLMFGEPLDPTVGNVRMVETSPVKSIENVNRRALQFTTRNSTYRLDILEGQ